MGWGGWGARVASFYINMMLGGGPRHNPCKYNNFNVDQG